MIPRAATTPKVLLEHSSRFLQHQLSPGSIPWAPADWECWGVLVLFQHRDQARPGDKTPQELFTSRAKLTSAEGKEEPRAGPCLLQTSAHFPHQLFPQRENKIFLGFNHQGLIPSHPALSPACPPHCHICNYLPSSPFHPCFALGKGKQETTGLLSWRGSTAAAPSANPKRFIRRLQKR